MKIFKHKKNLGQHFLINKQILKKICMIHEIKNKTVLEIGPGKGYLTEYILKKDPAKLFIIEKDTSLAPYLEKIKDKYPKKLEILLDDIMKVDLKCLTKKKILLIANLPYNLASTLVVEWLKYINIFESLVIMVQKEVAERLLAQVSTKLYGRLSVLVQVHANVEKKFDVNPENFFPKPKVISSVIELKPKKRNFKYDKLDFLLKTSFSHRRKKIRNNLKKISPIYPIKNLKECQIDSNLRPQDISPNEYIKLSKLLN